VYHRRQPARVVLLGMRCAFTAPVLTALAVAPGVAVRAVVLPQGVEAVPEPASDAVLDVSRQHGIPLVDIHGRADLATPEFRATLEAIAPDAIVVACFPWRLPEWLLALPRRGCLNVHPSLLPDGRGPEPVFWAFRWGLAETGVTVHMMDAGFDTGPVVGRQRFAIRADATIPSLERALARLGADLLIERVPAVLDGSAAATAQAGEPARYAPIPRVEDLVVPTSWSAAGAARFIRAVVSTYGPIPVLVQATGQRLAVAGVRGVDDNTEMAEPVRIRGPEAHIRFSPGLLVCRLAATPRPVRLHRRSG